MTLKFWLIVPVLMLLTACGGGGSSSPGSSSSPSSTRSFAMGFTPFPYDYSSDATTAASILATVYTQLASNADLVTDHFDNGIPWADALNNKFPYAAHIMDDWKTRRDKLPAGAKRYVAITPINAGRDGMALLRGSADNMTLPAPFNTYAANGEFNATDVETAYLNYCKQVIAYFKPDYLAIGIEVNLLRKNTNATTWSNYVALNHYVYTELKKLYPSLPIFVSVSPVEAIQGYVGPTAEFNTNSNPAAAYAASQLSAIHDVLVDSDDYAISLYPYMTAYFNSPLPSDMLDRLFSLSSKPLVIAETGMLAENLTIMVNGQPLTFTGSNTAQDDYLKQLLATANTYHARFINWFILRDYDQLCAAKGGCSDAQKMWRNTGLYDSADNPRPSHTTWMQWLARQQN